MSEYALSITLVEKPDLPSVVLQALYRITGRSTVELRRSILGHEPVYTAELFGADHIHAVPRLEKAAAYLDEIGLDFTVSEWVEGTKEEISRDTMSEILQVDSGIDEG